MSLKNAGKNVFEKEDVRSEFERYAAKYALPAPASAQ